MAYSNHKNSIKPSHSEVKYRSIFSQYQLSYMIRYAYICTIYVILRLNNSWIQSLDRTYRVTGRQTDHFVNSTKRSIPWDILTDIRTRISILRSNFAPKNGVSPFVLDAASAIFWKVSRKEPRARTVFLKYIYICINDVPSSSVLDHGTK